MNESGIRMLWIAGTRKEGASMTGFEWMATSGLIAATIVLTGILLRVENAQG